ncbi:Protein of unknown function, partial [Cotesia congregata]
LLFTIIYLSFPSQLIPEGYLPVSMFPFHPASSNNLRSGISIPRGHSAAKEIILPNDCYWIAQNVGYPVTNISDPNSRPSFVYQNTRIHPEASRQANQSPDKKSSGSDTSYSSVN